MFYYAPLILNNKYSKTKSKDILKYVLILPYIFSHIITFD